MEDQYGMGDLRQLMKGRSHFPGIPQPAELFSGHLNNTPGQNYEMMMMMGGPVQAEILPRGLHQHHHHHHHDHHLFRSAESAGTSTASITVTGNSAPSMSGGLEVETAGCLAADGGTGRWPRQETLTLLEIRSRLDSKFKEANQKGPLWDEVSRIMSEEHGYQRSGKKCREKFENLYKYYKKTKEGKAGRQDGKHYRFFRQLEALYGETSNNQVSIPEPHFVGNHNLQFHHTLSNTQAHNQEACNLSHQKHCDSLSLSNSSEFNSSGSSDDNELSGGGLMENDSSERRRKRRGKSWKVKIKEFIDSQMRKLMEKQEAWLEKLMRTLEQKEKERNLREEEWRKQEGARIDREQKFWAKERAWIENRDAALMDALQKLTGREIKVSSPPNQDEADGSDVQNNVGRKGENWPELEITRLIQLRTSLDSRFQQQGGFSEEVLWEEIAAKMACSGYERSSIMCKEKWESINNYLKRSKEEMSNKKRKENSSRSCSYFQNNNESSSIYNHGFSTEINEQGAHETTRLQPNEVSSPSNANVGHDSCFPFLMAEGENLWENYGLKLNKGGGQN
ncbi:hypothetical protein UlMin_005605, partial [Ulmus minor]